MAQHSGKSKPKPLKVVIVGAGLAGLVLALSLEKAGIDYVLLEARNEISPQIGSSIGILPNGARILDQLGVYDDILKESATPTGNVVWIDGKKVNESHPEVMTRKRLGYAAVFILRSALLQVIWRHITTKEKVKLNSKAVSVEHSEKGVTVKLANGTSISGDVLIGTDGIHSKIRSEMRRLADIESPSIMDPDRNSISAEYACCFGVSENSSEIPAGSVHRAYGRGHSFLTIGGNNAMSYWFLFVKLKQRYFAPNIPRWSKEDTLGFAEPFFDEYITGGTKFRTVWEKAVSSGVVPTEESHNEKWSWGRIACLGDAIHKVTPNAGAGGNSAIESAAAMANSLVMLQSIDSPNFTEIKNALEQAHDSRQPRMKLISESANNLTRLEALDHWSSEGIVRHVIPKLGDYFVNTWSQEMVGAEKLHYLPAPKRTQGISMPYNRSYGIGTGSSFWKRLFFALPFLGIIFFARVWLGGSMDVMWPLLSNAATQGFFEDPTFGKVPLRTQYTGYPGFDQFVSNFVACFTPSIVGLVDNPLGTGNLYSPDRLQMITFLTDLAPVYAIWNIESARSGNALTFAYFPLIFGVLFQLMGVGYFAPLYYFLHTVFLPTSTYYAGDSRLVRRSYLMTLSFSMLLGYYIPLFLTYLPSANLETPQAYNAVWQFFPVYISLLQLIFSTFMSFLTGDTIEHDKVHNDRADVPWLRSTYILLAAISAIVFNYIRYVSPIPVHQVLLDGVFTAGDNEPLAVIANRFLKYDHLFFSVSGALWLVYNFWGLKKEGRMSTSWGVILPTLMLVTALFGPGTTMAVGWAWREEVMIRRT